MSPGKQDLDLVQNVLAADSIPALTDDPVHDALVTAYFRADSTRNALVLSLPPAPTTTAHPASHMVDRAAVALKARIAGTEELRQMLKRLILHCRGGAREMHANLTHVDLNVGLNVLRTAHVAQRCHAQAQASFEPPELRAARQSRLEGLKTAGDVVAEYLHSRPRGGQDGIRIESSQPEGNAAPGSLRPSTEAWGAVANTPDPSSSSSDRLPSSQTPIEFWHDNRGAILRRLQLDPARQDTYSSLEEVFAALLGTDLSLDIKALSGLHQLSFIASLAFPAEQFHPLPDPVACPLFARGRQALARARQQLAATLAVASPRDIHPHDGDGRTNGDTERGLCQLGQMSQALIWLGHHEAVSGSPDFETYLASRTPVASILRIVEGVVMLVEEISKEDGTCPEDCHLYMVLLGQIAASKRE